VAGDLASVVEVLADAGVEVILIGGLAAQAHGASRLTQDVDFIYRRTRDNVQRLVDALSPHQPYLRGAPPGLPFRFDVSTVMRGLNFTLTTSVGDVDLLGEMVGGGTYEQVEAHTVELSVFGRRLRVLDLPALIRAKRAAGRPKDLEAIAELEALLVERERLTRPP
jgi:predicted nucleotidyltransferase